MAFKVNAADDTEFVMGIEFINPELRHTRIIGEIDN